MKRHLARLLALALVPILIFSTSVEADAATRYGPKADWTTKWTRIPAPAGQGDIECNATAYWTFDGFQQAVETKLDCSFGNMVGSVFGGENWDVRLKYSGRAVVGGVTGGAVCGMANTRTDETNISNLTTITSTQGYQPTGFDQLVPPTVEKCNVDQVCYSFIDDGAGDDKEHDGCTAVTVGYPTTVPPATTGCVHGAVTVTPAGDVTGVVSKNDPGGGYYTVYYSGKVNVTGGPAQIGIAVWVSISNGPPQVFDGGTAQLGPGSNLVRSRFFSQGGSDGSNVKVLGVQLRSQAKWDAPNNYTHTLGSSTAPATATGGLNWPARCSFYFGTKIADRPTDTFDEPVGPLGPGAPASTDNGTDTAPTAPTSPTEPTGGCTFKITDPTTWLEGGMCAAVGMLSAIWDALKSLLGAVTGIPAAILAGLRGLFVPSDGFFEDQVDDVKTAWDDTPPGEVVGTFATLPDKFSAPASASTCGGPSIPITWGMGGQGTDFRPFSTCEGWADNLATIVRVGLRVGIYLGAFLLCLRILAASLGLHISIGSGKDDD